MELEEYRAEVQSRIDSGEPRVTDLLDHFQRGLLTQLETVQKLAEHFEKLRTEEMDPLCENCRSELFGELACDECGYNNERV